MSHESAPAGAHHPPHSLPDLLAPGLDVVFVGFNPSLRAWRSGHYYANPTNAFYRLLHASGLTPRLLLPEEDGLLLGYGVGVTDLLAGHPSARADELPASQYKLARQGLLEKLETVSPRVVAFNGLGVYTHLYGERPPKLGLQDRHIGRSLVWVLPSSSGAANGLAGERRATWLALGELVRSPRGGW
ncbi:MAG: mismatch-specific DNA-glycosylase [Chloroflexota bacterium]|nr:mismatch-specific DNA-glycosylase [Chloroflexota bacterium]